MRKYFVYFKSNQRHMAEKDLSFGHVGIFQTSPRRKETRQTGQTIGRMARPPACPGPCGPAFRFPQRKNLIILRRMPL